MSVDHPARHGPAIDLIRAGLCSASCLCGSDESIDTCTCRCGGEYHGALALTEVEVGIDRRPWWKHISGPGTWIGETAPDIPVTTAIGGDYERIYHRARKLDRPAVWVQTIGDQREACIELPDTAAWATLHEEQAQHLAWFLAVLAHRERVITTHSPSSARIIGDMSTTKAQVLAAILDYAFHGKRMLHPFKALTGWQEPDQSERRARVTWLSMADLEDESHQEDERWHQVANAAGITLGHADTVNHPTPETV